KASAAEKRRQAFETQKLLAEADRAEADPLQEISAREVLDILDEELQRLPEAYRNAVILCCVEGRTQEEAARLLGWTVPSLQARVQRGRARLHRRLTKRGLGLSAALAALEVSRSVTAATSAMLAKKTVEAALMFATGSLPAAATSGRVGFGQRAARTMRAEYR